MNHLLPALIYFIGSFCGVILGFYVGIKRLDRRERETNNRKLFDAIADNCTLRTALRQIIAKEEDEWGDTVPQTLEYIERTARAALGLPIIDYEAKMKERAKRMGLKPFQ